MMRRCSRCLTTVATLPLLMLSACGSDDSPADSTTVPGVANPASEFCVSQGGTVEIVDEANGQVGYCNLPDGSRVEEWEYFRAQTGSTVLP
jgi:putative hemolysin